MIFIENYYFYFAKENHILLCLKVPFTLKIVLNYYLFQKWILITGTSGSQLFWITERNKYQKIVYERITKYKLLHAINIHDFFNYFCNFLNTNSTSYKISLFSNSLSNTTACNTTHMLLKYVCIICRYVYII